MDAAWLQFIDERTGVLNPDEWDTLKRQADYRLAYRLWTQHATDHVVEMHLANALKALDQN